MRFWMGFVSFFGILSFKNCTLLVLFESKKDKRPSKSPGNMQCVEQVRKDSCKNTPHSVFQWFLHYHYAIMFNKKVFTKHQSSLIFSRAHPVEKSGSLSVPNEKSHEDYNSQPSVQKS